MSMLAMFLVPPLLVAAVADVRFRIIPDAAVLAVAGIGLVAAVSGGPALLALLTGMVGLMLGFGFWWIGGWGLGDAKLLGAAGLVAGPSGFPLVVLVMALVGGVMAAVLLLLLAPARAGRLAVPAVAPRWVHVEARRLRLAPSLPYGLAIVAGLAAAVLAEG